MADVQGGVDVRGEQAVARDDRLLGGGGPARQAEPAGGLALVQLRALGQPRLLRVLRDHAVERLDVLERPAHQQRVGDAEAVVGEDPDPGGGVGHRAELGELLAVQADGDRADRADVDVPGLLAEPPDLLDDAGRVGDRLGVGHRVHRRVAAERGGAGAGLHGLRVLAARLAQVRVQVDEAGQRDQAGRVEDGRAGRGQAAADRGDDAAVRWMSAGSPPAMEAPLISHSLVHRVSSAAPPSIRYRTAIRTVTPLATCATIVELGGVGDLGGDLHAAVHRARVHDDGVLGQQRHPAGVEAVAAAVLADGREVGGAHPLLLHPQHHHHVALAQLGVEVVAGPARPRLDRVAA